MPSAVCLLDNPYILTPCPFYSLPLAELIQLEPLNDRSTYALLRGVLSTLDVLFEGGITGVSISSDVLFVSDLSPEDPHFWLAGISSSTYIRCRN